MTIYSKQIDNETEVERFEAEFRARGYRKVEKTNDYSLKPLEYIMNSWSGGRDSFERATHYEITWRSPD